MPVFSILVMERTYQAPDDARYGSSLIAEHLGLPKDPASLYDDDNRMKSEYYPLLLRLLAESYLKHKFVGHWHDVNILSAVSNTEICLFEMTSFDDTPCSIDHEREWNVSIKASNPSSSIVLPEYTLDSSRIQTLERKWIARVKNMIMSF